MDIVDKTTDDATLRFYMAQALGARAYSYWMLAQLWQFNYMDNPEAPCVPIITENNAETAAVDGIGRATVRQVYAQILNDIETAIGCLDGNPVEREDKRYIDIAVLYGLRARANLCMGKYEDAYSDAKEAISRTQASPLSAAEASVPGFNNADDHNWMWGIIIEEPDANGLYTFSGFMGSFSYGYAYAGQWQLVNSRLFDRVPSADVRKGWWINPVTRHSIADNYFATYQGLSASEYLDAVEAPEYAVVKFAPYNDVLRQPTGATDIPLMRVEEMYLIAAEAKAMTNATEGKSLVEEFVNTYRWTDSATRYSCNATTSEAVRDEIFFQRQIELWGEGFEYIDRLRLNKGIDRRNANFNPDWAFNIPAKAAVLLYQIPQAEIEGNPGITQADQNPAGTAQL
ncbi:MAG: RagB/SusD family nutrient uptake outer membrane protein [Muribaculaceae bacterium]|uniref:RagB/SusD family nutrient uptake outer membrane protein n=1 Tax=uncultured Duncaniella sp. TaxID=2768039 RepID=UPI0026E56D78|nr:RagB/SusD family nutrient uptake outer membrane protein [uncultured Duncaniella sp.]